MQSMRGAQDAASLNVTLLSPQSSAIYYVRVYADAAGTQPDGDDVQVNSPGRSGTAADPFTFTWPYTAGSPPVQRRFIVEADADGDGPGQRLKSTISGPVLVGEWLVGGATPALMRPHVL